MDPHSRQWLGSADGLLTGNSIQDGMDGDRRASKHPQRHGQWIRFAQLLGH
jgi:hypothetical protein